MSSRATAAVAVLVMLVLDAILVAWAMGLIGAERPPDVGGAAAQPGAASSGSAADSSGPAEEESPTSDPDVAAVGAVAAAGSTAWRATRGECDGEAPRLERSDGDGSWSGVQIDAAAIYRLRFTEPSVGFVVGAGESCEPVVFTTGDGGESWQEVAADQTWAPLPKGEVLVPGGGRVTVCEESEVVSLAPAGGAAAWGVCDDGRLLRGTSGDAPWEEVPEVSAATSVAAEGGRLLVTSTGEDCDGLLVASGSTDDEALGEPVCVQGARGALAAMTAEGGVLVAEGQRWTSTDLTTWDPAT